MRRITRRVTRDQLTERDSGPLSDGVGGTITGGPMEPIDLFQVLERGAPGASRSGAVSGAAQVMIGSLGRNDRQNRGVALSDGSRISFASVADAGVLEGDDPSLGKGRSVRIPLDGEAPAPGNGYAHGQGERPARVLTSV